MGGRTSCIPTESVDGVRGRGDRRNRNRRALVRAGGNAASRLGSRASDRAPCARSPRAAVTDAQALRYALLALAAASLRWADELGWMPEGRQE
jgi:hypothetical protein